VCVCVFYWDVIVLRVVAFSFSCDPSILPEPLV
jgi:hypothetical protein